LETILVTSIATLARSHNVSNTFPSISLLDIGLFPPKEYGDKFGYSPNSPSIEYQFPIRELKYLSSNSNELPIPNSS
jgi:hypothetical protein